MTKKEKFLKEINKIQKREYSKIKDEKKRKEFLEKIFEFKLAILDM